MSRIKLVAGSLILGVLIAIGISGYLVANHSGRSDDAAHTDHLTWSGNLGPRESHGWTQLVFDGYNDQFPLIVRSRGSVRVKVQVNSKAETEVMVLSADQEVTPAQQKVKAAPSDFVIAGPASQCLLPVLVYVRQDGTGTPRVSSASASVSYEPLAKDAKC